MSQALLEMTLKFVGSDKIVKCELERATAPLTIQALMDLAPFSRRGMMNVGATKSYYMILVEIKKGREKTPVNQVAIKDVVYDPMQDAIYLIYRAGNLRNPVIKLGTVSQGFDLIPTLTNGIMAEISFKDIS
jgi:hypothetical protein